MNWIEYEYLLSPLDWEIIPGALEYLTKMNCTTGTKGRLKHSKREFEIVKTTSTTSTIRFRWENQEHVVEDKVLHDEAEMITEWSEKHVEAPK